MKELKERKPGFETISGLEVKSTYGAGDLPQGWDSELSQPGEFPYTRGIHPSMYRGRFWTMRQYAGFGSAKEANQRYRYLLSQGTTGLSMAFDLPTQMGRDSDHKLSRGEVGKVGVAISSLEDMRILLDGIPLEKVSVSMTINATAGILLGFLLLIAKERGIAWDRLRGTIQNDLLKEYIARGTYIYPPRHALRIVTDIFAFCSREVPHWNSISISGYHIREAGSTAVEEVAFTLADAICYVESALKAGLQIDAFAPQLAFFFNCHNNFLEEVSKFRAARRLWAKIMKERFGAKKPESMMLRFHTQTAGSSLTAQQPFNNIVRTTVQAMAAVFGGTQSLHTNAYDEALALPSEDSAAIALRSQQIIAHESGIADSVDPLAGSFLVESWTDRIEREAEKLIGSIDALGGMLPAIENCFPQRRIEESAYNYQKKIERKDLVIVGVNEFVAERDVGVELLKIDPSIEKEQVKRLLAYKGNRDTAKVSACLTELRTCAQGDGNLMHPLIAALEVGGTLGEASDVLREIFGEYSPTSSF